MKEYATISIPNKVKKALEKAKGKNKWGEFLLNLYAEVETLRSRRAFEQLADTISDEDLKAILESSKEFREKLKLR